MPGRLSAVKYDTQSKKCNTFPRTQLVIPLKRKEKKLRIWAWDSIIHMPCGLPCQLQFAQHLGSPESTVGTPLIPEGGKRSGWGPHQPPPGARSQEQIFWKHQCKIIGPTGLSGWGEMGKIGGPVSPGIANTFFYSVDEQPISPDIAARTKWMKKNIGKTIRTVEWFPQALLIFLPVHSR